MSTKAGQLQFELLRSGILLATGHLRERYRRRKAGGRFAEKLVTLTIPNRRHATLENRAATIRETWRRFSVDLGKWLAETFGALASGVLDPKTGEELPLNKCVQFYKVEEFGVDSVLSGKDTEPHVHLHLWLYGPFIPKEKLRELWARAYSKTVGSDRRGACACRQCGGEGDAGPVTWLPFVEIRKAEEVQGKSLAVELVKYLLNLYSVAGGDLRLLPVAVHARIWKVTQGIRRRQGSRGLSRFKAERACSCKVCGHRANASLHPQRRKQHGKMRTVLIWRRPHWAHVDVIRSGPDPRTYPRTEQVALARGSTLATPGVLPRSRSAELREAYDAQADARWRESFDRRIVRGRLELLGIVQSVLPRVASGAANCEQTEFPF
ncbi:MAG: hypothetical protein ABI548_08850 [Polyangiaceae bacterium]